MDIKKINLYKNISIVTVPGSASKNLAAQAGLFTLQREVGESTQVFAPNPMELEFSILPETPLYKVTVPVTESDSIIGLCELYGITASTLFPGYDGAARAVIDYINWRDKKESL